MVDGPYQYLTDTGVIVTDTSDVRTVVEGEWKDALGSDLVVSDDTPQGTLITAEALARSDVIRNDAALANQINPDISGGVFLAAICALTGLDDNNATYSTISADGITLSGEAGSIIPVGSQARTAAGDMFQTISAVELNDDGIASVGMQAVESGPVPCDVGALVFVVTDVLGWESVTNTVAATVGLASLSDPALRRKRNDTLAGQGRTLAEAMTSAVALVPGFKSRQFRENVKDSPQTIDGINLAAKSVWMCVDGGTDADVAFALLSSKSGGCDWNGALDVDVTDPSSGQVYTVSFDRPAAVPVLVRVTFRAPASAVSPQDTVVQAVLDYAAGLLDGQAGFVVGSAVSPFEIAGAVMTEFVGVFVQKVEVALKSDGIFQTTEIELTLKQLATVLSADITAVVA